MFINAETLVALGAESFPIQVKGGIARAPGEQSPCFYLLMRADQR